MIKTVLKGILILFGIFIVFAFLSGLGKKSSSVAIKQKEAAKQNTETSGLQQINIPGWSDSPYITGDGEELYYMYSRYNFFPIFTGGKPILQGENIEGHHNNDANPFDDSDIYVSSRKQDGTWSKPANLPFNDTRGGCCAMVVEGPPFTIYYQVYTPANKSTDLVYRMRDVNGNYGEEINFGPNVNSSSNEDNPHVSEKQDKVWFTSVRPGGKGGSDIWYSEKTNGEWRKAVNVSAINTEKNEDQAWVSKDGSTMYYNSDRVYKVSIKDGVYGTPQVVDLGRPIAAEVSLTDDGKEIFFGSADPEAKRIRIYHAYLKADGSWGTPAPVD